MTGEPDGPPQFVHMGIADVFTGVHAFGAIAAALFHKLRTGRGQYIDIAMVDAIYHAHEVNVQVYANSGGAYVPKRGGSRHPIVGPYGIYKGPEGYIAILVLERQWPGFVEAVGKPELAKDPRYATGALRGQNRELLAAMIEEWMKGFKTDADVLEVFERHRVPASPVLSVADTLKQPYFEARAMVRRVPDRILGEVTIPGFPLKFSENSELPDIQAPFLGEHNAEILREHLGFTDAKIAELTSSGLLISGKT
jgi:crotonobetainyl-CoA:carnitine CoA-transferase CaiB-like acyl-CoA transferase